MSKIKPDPDPARRLRVFLCHSSGDKPAVRNLYRKLHEDGFDPWLDKEKLLPGQNWRLEIPKAIRNSDVVIVCVSRSSLTKEGYLQNEIKDALQVAEEKPPETIFIIPVRLEEVDIPERLSDWHAADIYEQGGYQYLTRALELRASSIGLTRPSSAAVAPGSVRLNPKDDLNYVWIPPGTFQMGCSPGDTECNDDEKPAHQVTISKGFWLGQTPVTVAAYKRFVSETSREMPPTPRFNEGWNNALMAIVNVTWDEAQAYCAWAGGRLPMEAEWEYAARGGTTEARYGPLDEIGWYEGNSGGRTHEVGVKRPNRLGLFDMLGNVWEWVNDWYDAKYREQSPSADPPGPSKGEARVLRGGGWDGNPGDLRAANRLRGEPDVRGDSIGFRCVRELVP
jgi:formylglycine-generating enzyme required for sulfatase activity